MTAKQIAEKLVELNKKVEADEELRPNVQSSFYDEFSDFACENVTQLARDYLELLERDEWENNVDETPLSWDGDV